MIRIILLSWSFIPLAVVASEPLPLGSDYWKDPAFLKSFNGSYRIEARIEPAVSTQERGLLVEVQALMGKGQRANALAKLEGSSLSKNSAALAFNIGNLHFEEGDDGKATAAYQKAIDLYPAFRRALRNLAMSLVRQGEMEKALDPLLEAIRLGDSGGSTFGLLGYCRIHREEWASALQAYRLAQLTEPEVLEWKAGIAQCLQQTGGQEEALALLEEVIRQRPRVSSYAVLQATILLDLGRSEEAVKALDLPRRLGTLGQEGMLLLADLHLRSGRRASAHARVDEALAQGGKAATTSLVSLTYLALSLEEWKLAGKLVEAIKANEQEDKILQRRLEGHFLILSGEDRGQGVTILRNLLNDVPDDGKTLLILGRHLVAEKELEEAELLFERSTAVKSVAAEGWLELSSLRVEMQDYPGALRALDESLALQSSKSLLEYRTSLQSLVEAAQ